MRKIFEFFRFVIRVVIIVSWIVIIFCLYGWKMSEYEREKL